MNNTEKPEINEPSKIFGFRSMREFETNLVKKLIEIITDMGIEIEEKDHAIYFPKLELHSAFLITGIMRLPLKDGVNAKSVQAHRYAISQEALDDLIRQNIDYLQYVYLNAVEQMGMANDNTPLVWTPETPGPAQ